jgi:hypothetical protein
MPAIARLPGDAGRIGAYTRRPRIMRKMMMTAKITTMVPIPMYMGASYSLDG